MANDNNAPMKAARRMPTTKSAKPIADGWQASEDDWAYLQATTFVRAWQLVSLACGLHPKARLADQLPPEIAARYRRLRKTVRGSLSSKAGKGVLICDPEAINAGSTADTQAVKLSDFVEFMDSIGEEIDQRMRQIATDAKAVALEASGVTSNPALERSIELARLRIDAKLRPEDITRRLKSVSRLLLAVAVHNDSYRYDVTKLDREGKTIAGEPSKVFAALSEAVSASGLGKMDGETVRDALWFAIDMCGRDMVTEQLLPKKT